MQDLIVKVTSKAIQICWIHLFIALFIKIFIADDYFVAEYGTNIIKVTNFIDSHFLLYKTFCIFICFVSINLLSACAIGEYWKYRKQIIKFAIVYSILNNLLNIFFNNFIMTFLTFSLYVFWFLLKCKISVIFKVMILDFLFQFISITSNNVELFYMTNKSISFNICFFDYYIMLSICSLKNNLEGENKWQYGEWEHGFSVKNLKNSLLKSINLKTNSLYIKQKLMNYKNLLLAKKNNLKNCKILILNLKYNYEGILKNKVIPFIFVFGISFLYAFLNHKVLELCGFIYTYGTIRYIFPKTFHADYIPNIKKEFVIWTCNILSTIMFILVIDLIKNFSHSLLYGVVIAILVNAFLYQLILHIDLSVPENKLKCKCRNCGIYKEEDIDFILQYKFHKVSIKEQALLLGMEIQSIKNKRTKFNKILNNSTF